MHQLEGIAEVQQGRVLNALEACQEINSVAEFKRYITQEFTNIVPHEHFAFGVASFSSPHADSPGHVRTLINVNFDPGYLSRIIDPEGNLVSPTFQLWWRNRHPQCHDEKMLAPIGPEWCAAIRDYGLNNVGGHGLVDLQGSAVSYFGFGNLESGWWPRQARLLDLFVPHFYVVLQRFVAEARNQADGPQLSPRQQEIMKWVTAGKSNWEIGMILHISETTVRNQLVRIMRKLDVHTRTHALAKAIELGLISL